MDETSLNELLECSVCLERLDATSRVLPCQHTFCRRCLEEIISTKSELRCPECRTLVDIRIEELPTNILLIRLLEGIKTAAHRASGSSSPAGQPGSLTTSPTHLPSTSVLPKGSPGHKTSSSNTSSQPCAKALYNYEAKEPGDLSFKKGDLILLRKQVDENWYHGELSGQHGFFPATYVQVVSALSQDIPKCKALFDFAISDKNEKDCLTFQKDEVITVIRRVDDNWAEGKLGDRIGIFPISFVEMNDSAKWLITNQASAKNSLSQLRSVTGPVPSPSSSSSGSSTNSSPGSGGTTVVSSGGVVTSGGVSSAATDAITRMVSMAMVPYTHPSIVATQRGASQKRHSLTSVSMSPQRVSPPNNNHHRHSMELPSNLGLTTVTQVSPAVVSSAPVQVSTSTAGPKISARGNGSGDAQSSMSKSNQTPVPVMVPAFFIALYNYKPQKDDEIELKKGSLYTVSEKCQDGWFKGQCMKEGKTGVFPGNYVQTVPLKMSPAKSANGSPRMVVVPTLAGQVASKQPHVTVNRAHSFPKTSPLAGTEFATRPGAIRAPAASTLRPITNVTQAHVRSTQGAAHTVASPLRTNPSVASSSPLHTAVTSTGSSLVSATTATTNNVSRPSNSRSSNSGAKVQNTQVTTVGSTSCNSGSERNHSPRSGRRCERARRGGSHSHSPSHQPASSQHSSQQGQGHSYPSPLPSLHPAMSTNASLTPPNVVIGATGVSPLSGSASQQKEEKVKKEKREKDKLSLMKRLASAGITGKGKKSKSPPPGPLEGATASTSTSPPQPPATHQRSASLSTANSSDGASAAAPSSGSLSHHKKSGSLDSSKPSKLTKPLARERYRCIAPYPPQSDIELELKVGDFVYVHKKREDGWYKGTLQRTGKTGLFPGSFVDKF